MYSKFLSNLYRSKDSTLILSSKAIGIRVIVVVDVPIVRIPVNTIGVRGTFHL